MGKCPPRQSTIHVGKVKMRVERERDENAALESETETAYRRFGTWRVLGQRVSLSLALSKG